MHTYTITVLVTGSFLAAGSIFAGQAWTQGAPARPAVQDVSVKPIGKVVTAKGAVTIEHVNAVVVQAALGNRAGRTKVGDPVYLGDIVKTGADGQIGITFADGTAFNMSSNARMALTEYVYDPNSKSNSTFFSLTKGAFTFIAGKIAKTGDMKIDTPVATMGIRGTTPRVEISDDGTVKFSTLIEKGKNEVLEKYSAASIKPHDSAASPDSGAVKEHKKLNLNICKGC
jgi:hypothetical protein